MEGESLNDYILRLEALADSPRLRIPEWTTDDAGNVYLIPVAAYFTDSGGTPHEGFDTSGRMATYDNSGWPAAGGTVVDVSGTFTKNATGSVGEIDITPNGGTDRLYFMYGILFCGAARAGGADGVWIQIESTAGVLTTTFVHDLQINAAENLQLPTCEADAALAVNNNAGMNTLAQTIVDGTDSFHVQVDGMANTETFTFRSRFLSRDGGTPTVGPTAGTWA